MSSLILYTDEKQALVATDTLVVSREDKEPLYFASQAIYLPHLKTIIASTGLARFMEQWLSIVNQLPADDIHELNDRAPGNLIKLFDWFNSVNCYEIPEEATVYHIGFSEKDHKISSFAYTSANNFNPEPLAYGLAIQPPCPLPEGNFKFIDDVPLLMNKQREEQRKMKPDKRSYIGGEIYGMYLTAEGCNSFKLGVFDDYSVDKQKIEAKQVDRK
ncbi:MAG: hypothetical protein H6Q52_818 [Deltaproteobacteria bacterium]|nr:hypothetical protein [Deltaproteobacteria bacterium]